jgi:aryl-phospho-beta-D-glucosidase BglC (GH1 family)
MRLLPAGSSKPLPMQPQRHCRILPILLVLGSFLAGASARAGFLHANGVTNLDIDNNPIVLRGVDLGCWLWPEFYMMGNVSLPNYANAGTGGGGINNYYDALTAAIRDVLGGDTNLTAQVLDAYWSNFVSAADIAYLRSQGFNSVRVPFTFEEFFQVTNWANNYPSNGFDVSTGFKYLDNLVAWCSSNSIYVIPDMHCAPGGPNNWSVTNYGGGLNTNSASVFASASNLALAEHIWARIAARYAANPWIGGYDLLNEPVNTSSPSLQVGSPWLSQTYAALVSAIRAVDANHLLLCEGDLYATTFYDVNNTGWTDANWSFSDHDYGSALPLGTGNRAAAVGANVPDWAGEFGLNSTRWYNRIVTGTYENPVTLTANGRTATITQGHCFWAYKSCLWDTVVENPQTAGWNTLKAYWASGNTLPKPSVSNAFNWLIGYAQAANFSNCIVHIEVADSLTRPATDFLYEGFAQYGLPYKNGVTIPGTIFAVDYDMGDSNVVYSDTVSESDINEGVSGPAWNSGFFGRDEGVSQTTCDDPGTLLKVGWNVAGDWQRHTVNCTPGTYNLFIRYAGGAAGGQMSVSLMNLARTNGAVVLASNNVSGIVSLPAPYASYTTYSTCVVSNVVVTNSGLCSLQFNVVAAGYDLAWVAFVPADGPPLPPAGETVVGAQPGIPRGLANGIQAAAGNQEIALNWVASPTAASYNVKRALASGGPYTTIASPAALGFLDTGLSNGVNYFYVVSAVNSNGESANSAQAVATPRAASLPSPWMDGDVGVAALWSGDAGDVGWPGAAQFAGETYTVSGSGIDIWNSADSFHYVFRAVSGDCALIAQVASLQNADNNVDPWAKAGVMVRESLNQDSANAFMSITGNNGSLFSWRPAAGLPSQSASSSGAAPCWVKLVRSGNTFTGLVSTMGVTWTQVGSQTIPMASNVFAGLAVTAHNNTELDTATFTGESLSITLPAAPAALAAAASPAQIALTWPSVSGADSYNVKRSAFSGGPYATVAMVINATNYADAAITNGITNYYVVTAVNANGESGDSPQASAAAPLPAITASGPAIGGAFTLSWPVSALNFTLCAAPALGPGANWTPVTNGQAVAGGTIFVTLSISGPPAQFFRLVYSPAP